LIPESRTPYVLGAPLRPAEQITVRPTDAATYDRAVATTADAVRVGDEIVGTMYTLRVTEISRTNTGALLFSHGSGELPSVKRDGDRVLVAEATR